jgi:hypothetical protein
MTERFDAGFHNLEFTIYNLPFPFFGGDRET